jgi:hypothetical protein
MSAEPLKKSPFDEEWATNESHLPIEKPGPGQFSLSTIALITFDLAFVLGWWANGNGHSRFSEDIGEYTNRVLGSTLRVGIVSYPLWTGLIAFAPALLGAALGTCAMADVQERRRLRGASLYWTLLSAMTIEWLVQWALLIWNRDSDAQLLFFAFGNLGWTGLGLIIYWCWMAMIAAPYGLVISLILALLARSKRIPLAAPWKDAPWTVMRNFGLYGPYIWVVGFLLWVLAGKPELLEGG